MDEEPKNSKNSLVSLGAVAELDIDARVDDGAGRRPSSRRKRRRANCGRVAGMGVVAGVRERAETERVG